LRGESDLEFLFHIFFNTEDPENELCKASLWAGLAEDSCQFQDFSLYFFVLRHILGLIFQTGLF